MDQALIEPAKQLLQTVGLPTLFCLWLMLRVEKRLDEQTRILTDMAASMSGVLEHVRKG